MANISLVTTGKLRVVESHIQMTLPVAETIAVGDAVRLDTSTGKWTKANGTTAGEARIWGIVANVDPAGTTATAIKKGVVDGFDLSSLAYDTDVYLSDTDGRIAGTAGDATVDIVIGKVVPATATTLGTAYDKILEVAVGG